MKLEELKVRNLDEQFWRKEKLSKEELIKKANKKSKENPDKDYMVVQDKESKLLRMIDDLSYIMTPIPSRDLFTIVYNTGIKL